MTRSTITPLSLAGALLVLLPGTAFAELPDAARKILQTAIDSGDAAVIQVVAGNIIKSYPDDAEEVRNMLTAAGSDAAKGALGEIDASSAKSEDVVPKVAIVTPEPPAPPPPTGFFGFDGWGGDVQLGGSLNTGNTDEKSLGVAIDLSREGNRWRHYFTGAFDFTRTDGLTSKRRLRLGYEINIVLDERSYLFGTTEYVNDRFSGYDYRIIAAGGYGYRVIGEDAMTWDLEAGPGYRYSNIRDSDASDKELVGRANSRFRWKISGSTALSNDVSVLYSSKTTTIDTLTAVTMAINSHLSGRLSFETNTDTNPPPGFEKTDTQTKASLVYGF